jgi:hypothetical protein
VARNYANWLQGYIEYTKASESPTSFHFWTGVATIAGALRRRVWIDERHFQWTPNFYIVLVGPPGVAAKSTSIRSGMKFLERLKIPFGPQSMTWQALTKAMEEAISGINVVDADGIEQRIVMSCLTIPVSELGTFLRMEDTAMIDVIVDLWDGQQTTWSHKTKSSGNIEIQNPWINLIACTTPSWLQNNFPEHMIGGGLMSRILFVYGEKKRQFVAYPSDAIRPQEHREIEEKLFRDLEEISELKGEYLLTTEAKTWGRAWYENHWNTRPIHMASDRYGGYIARKQTHIHKLAIVLAAAKRSKLVIEKHDLEEAATLVTSIEPDMQKVFQSVGVVDSARHMKELVSYVKAYGQIAVADLWKLVMNTIEYRAFQESIRSAIESGMIMGVRGTDGRPCLQLAPRSLGSVATGSTEQPSAE